MIRGEQARALCRALLAALEPAIPPEVIISVRGRHKTTHFKAVRTSPLVMTVLPGQPAHDRAQKHFPGNVHADQPIEIGYPGGSWTGVGAFGKSQWRRTTRGEQAQEAIIEALTTIQQVVIEEIHQDWPSLSAIVKATHTDDSVTVWFETPTGERSDVGTFAVELAVRQRRHRSSPR